MKFAEDSDYNGGSPHHKDPFYLIEVRLSAGRFETLTKQHLILDFTKITMLAEGKSPFAEDASRVWVTIVELQSQDWGIGGHTDWLRDYERSEYTRVRFETQVVPPTSVSEECIRLH